MAVPSLNFKEKLDLRGGEHFKNPLLRKNAHSNLSQKQYQSDY